MLEHLQRLLYYSPNTAGIGHVSRAIALLTGIRRYAPHLELLVVSGTSIPEQFSRHEIELVRIPALRAVPGDGAVHFKQRYLTNSRSSDVRRIRAGILNSVFDTYMPDLICIDHHPLGIDGEILPWLMRKRSDPGAFVTAYISRGIIAQSLYIQPPFLRPQRGIDVIDVLDLYDRLYILDTPGSGHGEVANINRFAGDSDKLRYLGRLTMKTRDELVPESMIRSLYGLPPGPIITASLGHGSATEALTQVIIHGFFQAQRAANCSLILVLSPYTSPAELFQLQEAFAGERVFIRPYLPNFIEVINISAAVICRGGYNVLTELELTGRPALIIPEDLGSQEQIIRAGALASATLIVEDVSCLTPDRVSSALDILLTSKGDRAPQDVNKYAVAQAMIVDLEELQLCQRATENEQ